MAFAITDNGFVPALTPGVHAVPDHEDIVFITWRHLKTISPEAANLTGCKPCAFKKEGADCRAHQCSWGVYIFIHKLIALRLTK